MIRDCIVIQPLREVPIDSEGDYSDDEYVETDDTMDEDDGDDELEERMEELIF